MELVPIRKMITDLAEKYPNALYQKPEGQSYCSNTAGKVLNGPETEGCIVGQVARDSGHPQLLANLANPKYGSTFSADSLLGLEVSKADNVFRISECEKLFCVHSDDINFALAVQKLQDSGNTWGEAVRKANESLGVS